MHTGINRRNGLGWVAAMSLPWALTAGAGAQAACSAVWMDATGPDAPVEAAVARGNDLYVAGLFDRIPGANAGGIARWNGVTWSAVGNGIGLSGPPFGQGAGMAIAVLPNGDVVVGGLFDRVDFTAAANVARWNGSAWSALGGGVNYNVNALCPLANGDLLVGGGFSSPAAGIARWNGSTWTSLGAGIGGSVSAIVVMPNGDVVVGGNFSTAGGIPAANVAKWNGSTWSPMGAGFTPGAGLLGVVEALAVMPDGTLVAGGWFGLSGTTAVSGVARWTGSAWAPLGLGVGIRPNSVPYYYVQDLLVLPSGDLLAGGQFNLAGGTPVQSLARWDGTNWFSVSGGVSGIVEGTALMPNGDLAVVGNFLTAGPIAASCVAVLQPTCRASAAPIGTGCAGAGGLDTLTANGRPWAGATFHATAAGLPASSAAFAAYGFLPTSVPLSTLLPQGLPGCSALLVPLLSELLVPSGGTAVTSVAIPNVPVAIGLQLLAQVVTLELDPSNSILAATSSNGLQLTIGVF